MEVLSPLTVGTAGVSLLLISFVLNLMGKLSEQGAVYLGLNFIGALLAACYAWAGRAYPFLVLEAVWAGVALFRLVALSMKSHR